MKRILFFFFAAVALLVSCDDTTDTLGTSLTEVSNNVDIVGKEFNVESHSVAASHVVSRSTLGYLGKVKDPETGAYITCNYMTQQRPMDERQFPGISEIQVKDLDPSLPKEQQLVADSCELVVYFNDVFGDSLALMKVVAHEMSVPYEEGKVYPVDFDPKAEDMIRTGAGSIHSQASYTVKNLVLSEDQRNSSTYRPYVSISLNDPYTDRDGKTYNNFGTYLMRKYFEMEQNPDFLNHYRFLHNICPGFYIENVGGIGCMASVYTTQVLVHFSGYNEKKEIEALATSFAGTDEVLQNTTVSQSSDAISDLVADPSCTYIKSPAGVFTELTLPVEEIMAGHENDTLNTARVFIPRINDTAPSKYSLPAPTTILLLPTDSVASFFDNKQVANYRTSYLASYVSGTNGYTFNNISYLVSNIYRKVKESGKSVAEYAAEHPDWNKVTLIPVTTTYSTVTSYSVLTKVTHDMSLRTTKLKKGAKDNDNIKMSVLYSKFNKPKD